MKLTLTTGLALVLSWALIIVALPSSTSIFWYTSRKQTLMPYHRCHQWPWTLTTAGRHKRHAPRHQLPWKYLLYTQTVGQSLATQRSHLAEHWYSTRSKVLVAKHKHENCSVTPLYLTIYPQCRHNVNLVQKSQEMRAEGQT
jgi:hypothetical protein